MNKEERDRIKANFDKNWERKKREIDDQIVELRKQREKFLADNKIGYYCKKCGNFVEKSERPLSHETQGCAGIAIT